MRNEAARPTLFVAEWDMTGCQACESAVRAGFILTKPAKAVFRVCGGLGGVRWAANRGWRPLSPPRLHTLSGENELVKLRDGTAASPYPRFASVQA